MISEDGFLRFEPAPIVAVLERHRVRYVVIGGIAGNLHGSTTITRDLDVCYARDPENLTALAAALTELDATLRGAPPGLPFRRDARTLRMGLNFTFDTIHGAFDCLGEATGEPRAAVSDLELHRDIAQAFGRFTYETLVPNAERMTIGEQEVLVVSLDDLIRMKRAAGRPKDHVEVENLSALRDVREEAAPYRARVRRASRTARRVKGGRSTRAR